MRDELLRILNVKLDDIKINIDSLTELNKKIDKADDNLSNMTMMLDKFKDNDKYNVLNLSRFSKEEFDNVLSIVNSDVKDIFKTKNCNYDGLVYLINGINNGVSLSLTIEQENAINYLISSMEDVMHSDMAIVDGLNLVKMGFEIDDIGVLDNRKRQFEKIIDELENDKYVDEIDDINEAMAFSDLDSSNVNEILVFLLKYNSDIYDKEREEVRVHEEETIPESHSDDIIVDSTDTNLETNFPIEDSVSFEDKKESNENKEMEFHLPEFNKIEEANEIVTPTTYNVPFVPEIDDVASQNQEDLEESNDYEEINVIPSEEDTQINDENTQIDESNNIDSDFIDIVPQDDYEEDKTLDQTISMTPINNEKTSTRELQRLFQDYNIKIDDNDLNEYVDGNIQEYKKIIDTLKDNGVLECITKNTDLFKEIIVGSTDANIINVLNIIKNDLSVDNEDYETTVSIVMETIPSIFVSDGGNYDNFIENVKLYKELGINLVNLFDFSKEVFVANHENVVENYEIVKEYGINIDYKNAKYFLLLDDIAERMDYYVESVYKDENKNEMFDGNKYIIDYPCKLNTVTSETIKRLRYSSENGRKVFGSKPNSLTGEITNLKVNVLDMPSEYMDNFFDNKFDDISVDEVRQYSKLCKNSSNVSDFLNELSFLDKYHDGVRYDIDGIKVSYNKVKRCYNTLRSYGIGEEKAREFAVCYNLVITKDEYLKLKDILREGAGE